MDKNNRSTGVYLVGIILMFGILIVIGSQILPSMQKNKSNSISINLSKPEVTIDTTATYLAKVATNQGEFTIELCARCAPKNVNNFIYLSSKNYYSSTKFHRIIKDLLIQAGDRNTLGTDITSFGKGKTSYLIEDEVNWDSLNLTDSKRNYLTSNGYTSNSNVSSMALTQYTVAMANDGANTNSSQFFIITAENSDSRLDELNGIYTVIGKVISGFDVLNKINNTPVVDSTSYLPATDITIQKIEIVKQ